MTGADVVAKWISGVAVIDLIGDPAVLAGLGVEMS